MPNNKKARSLSRPSKVNFTATFDAALVEYRRVTGQRLESNPSVVGQFKSCDSPEDILKVLQAQRDNVDEFRRSPLERLLLQLNPTFNVLLTLSGALGDAVGLVSHIRRSIGMTVLQHLVGRHSHPPKQSLPVSVFFSVYVFPPKFVVKNPSDVQLSDYA